MKQTGRHVGLCFINSCHYEHQHQIIDQQLLVMPAFVFTFMTYHDQNSIEYMSEIFTLRMLRDLNDAKQNQQKRQNFRK